MNAPQQPPALDPLERRFHAVLDLAPIAIWVTDKDHVVYANRACQALFGTPDRARLLGQPMYRFFPAPSHAALAQQVSRALSGEAATSLLNGRIVRADGSLCEVDIAIVALPDHGPTTLQMAISDITQRRDEHAQLLQSRQELRRLSASVVEAREEERRRIARELHDELGQRLSALKMDLSSLEHETRRPAYEQRIAAMIEMLDETVASLRRIAADLRPMMLDDLGLNAAVEWLGRESARHMGLAVTVSHGDTDPPLDSRASTAVYRMVQEALTNVARHARASHVRIELQQHERELVVVVQDDGVGFSERTVRKAGSFGLIGLRERADSLGGRLDIDNPAGGGGRITVRLPLHLDSDTAASMERGP